MTGWLIFFGGLCGALGVSLSAVAAHHPSGTVLTTGAQMLLVHAPAFLALAALAKAEALRGWALALGAVLLALGLAFFAGDLSFRALLGQRLFPYAAPVGGSLMIAGWVWIAGCGFISLLGPRKGG